MTTACACCHQGPPAGQPPFRKCSKCVEQNLVAALYCCAECQREDWPAHRMWHKQVNSLLEKSVTPTVAQAKVHAAQAGAYREAKDYARAFPELLSAIELFPEGSEEWGAVVAVACFTALAEDGISCAEDAKPAWMTDIVTRVKMAERAVASAPSNVEAWVMLGLGCAELGLLDRASTAMMRASKLAPADATRADYLEAARSLMQQHAQKERIGAR